MANTVYELLKLKICPKCRSTDHLSGTVKLVPGYTGLCLACGIEWSCGGITDLTTGKVITREILGEHN